jgi:hypothetical protein
VGPLEQKNILAWERAVADSLRERIALWREQMAKELRDEADLAREEVKMDEELLDYLRALGYVE